MIHITQNGNLDMTTKFLNGLKQARFKEILEKYAQQGVDALSAATPVDSGITAASWSYKIDYNGDNAQITWINSNVNQGVPIAIILQYGHGTGTGGYVQGVDYINPAMDKIHKSLSEELRKEVMRRG